MQPFRVSSCGREQIDDQDMNARSDEVGRFSTKFRIAARLSLFPDGTRLQS